MAKPNLALIPATIGDKVYSILPSDGVGDFDFTRADGSSPTGVTRINAQGLIEEVASGENRLNYSLLNGEVVGCPHLLLEPSRTNLVQYSEDFSQSAWTKGNSSIESDTLISPSGILNGSTLTDNTANTIHRLRDSVSLSASTDYSLSIFAKKGTLSNIQLALINTANSNTASRVFDLENGALGESITIGGTLQDSKITDYGNGWYRCEITAQLGSTPNTYQITLAPQSSGNSTTGNQVTYDGDGSGNVYLWGAQSEEGSFPTSYIKTTSAAVTRAAETCTGSGDAATFNDSEGVLYAEIASLANDGTDKAISISDGTNNNRIWIGYSTANERIYSLGYSGNTIQFVMYKDLLDETDFVKVAVKYKENDFALWVNGIEASTDNNGLTPVGLNSLNFNISSGSSDFYGNTKQIQYFDSVLDSQQLEQLTSWDSFRAMAEGQLYSIQ